MTQALAAALALAALFPAAHGQASGLGQRPQVGPFFDGVFPAEEPALPTDLSAVVAFAGLVFINPIGLLPIPGTGRLVAWEREGRVWSFANDPATDAKSLVLDLSDRCLGWGDCGLLGLAFHPDFESNGHLFVWYNWIPPETQTGKPTVRPPHQRDHRQRLARFTWDPAKEIFTDEYVLIDQSARDTWHSGGGMLFHPADGFLYLANGDDNDLAHNQRIDRGFFGCVIRIDVDKRGGAISRAPSRRADGEVGVNWPEAYYIPADNPFAGTPDALGEIYALGLRNPHRMTLDPVTGRIFIGDVSEGPGGEVNVIEPDDRGSLNFQWNRIEGYRGDLVPPYHGVSRRPHLQYRGSDGKAIIGGYVYRGPSIPELRGRYVFGDNFSNHIWAMDESPLTETVQAGKVLLATLPHGPGPRSWRDNTGLSSFGVDADGELYLCQMSSEAGRIYKLARSGSRAASTLPATLSATGLFRDTAALLPSPKLVPYGLNVPFWSDGAVKSRWAAIPTGTKVGFKAKGEWEWPVGTVMVKHFEMPDDPNDSSVSRRLETRVLVKAVSGSLYGFTYKWRADQSDADLLDSGFTETLGNLIEEKGGPGAAAIAHPLPDAARQDGHLKRWTYPSRMDCKSCHTDAAGGFLGPKTRQMNGDLLYPNGITDNQLRSWARAGLFDKPPLVAQLQTFEALAAPDDGEASLDKRARSYLDANCAYCHQPEGARTFWDARFDSPPTEQRILHGYLSSSMGDLTARVVVPGDLQRSMIHRRMGVTDDVIQMPPLAKNEVDQAGLALVEEWIMSLPANPPPAVVLDAPVAATRGDTIRLAASVSDQDGITRVEFFNGPDLLGEAASPPYEMFWSGAMIGGHSLVAVATDASGNAGASEARLLRVEVRSPAQPGAKVNWRKVAVIVALHAVVALLGALVFRKKKNPSPTAG